MIRHNVTIFNKDSYISDLQKKAITLDKFYRFRISEQDHHFIFANKRILKSNFDISFPDLMRYFARHCTDLDVLYALDLLNTDKEILDIKLRL